MCRSKVKKKVALTLEEIWFQVYIENVSGETLNRVVEGQDVDALAVLDVQALVHVDKITELDSQVVTSNFVHLDLAFLDVIGGQANEDCISPLLSPAARDQLLEIHERTACMHCTYLTMMVSPRKSWRASIVAGLSVATARVKTSNLGLDRSFNG